MINIPGILTSLKTVFHNFFFRDTVIQHKSFIFNALPKYTRYYAKNSLKYRLDEVRLLKVRLGQIWFGGVEIIIIISNNLFGAIQPIRDTLGGGGEGSQSVTIYHNGGEEGGGG